MEEVTGPGAGMGEAARYMHLNKVHQRKVFDLYLESNDQSLKFFKQENIFNGFTFQEAHFCEQMEKKDGKCHGHPENH